MQAGRGTHLGMNFFARLISFIGSLPRLIAAVVVAALVVSVFFLFVYDNGEEGQWLRDKVASAGQDLPEDGPTLPGKDHAGGKDGKESGKGKGGSHGKSGSGKGSGKHKGSSKGSDTDAGTIRAMKKPTESAWIASGPTEISQTDLDSIKVKEPYAPTKYDREKYFGRAWLDVDGNGCDTRNDVLARDLHDVDYSPEPGVQSKKHGKGEGVSGCKDATVYAGTFGDPYTGNIVHFVRGENSNVIDIEHILALEDAWDSGAWQWSQEKREAYANDPEVIMVVDGPENRAKGSASISQWQPKYKGAQCRYGYQYAHIAAKYGLSVSKEDMATLKDLQGRCSA